MLLKLKEVNKRIRTEFESITSLVPNANVHEAIRMCLRSAFHEGWIAGQSEALDRRYAEIALQNKEYEKKHSAEVKPDKKDTGT